MSVFFALLFLPLSAFAYLDPGTMSYFVQGLVAVLAGAGYAIKIFWSQIKGFFSRFSGSKNDEGNSQGSR